MSSEVYKFAAQNKLRFPSKRGLLTVEDLYDLPLTSKVGVDLNTIAKEVNANLKASSEEDFVTTTPADPRKRTLEVSLDILKDVIATKQAANAEALAKSQRAAQRQRILEALEAKKDQQLSQASIEDLQRQLQELGNI